MRVTKPMTPDVVLLLSKFGFPKLRIHSRQRMAKRNRQLAGMHNHKAHYEEPDAQRRAWRFQLRNNAIKRAEAWAS